MLNKCVRYLKNNGIKKVLIVVGKNKNDIVKKIKIMPNLNIDIKFIQDLKPQGIASSLYKIKRYIKGPILVFLGDIFLREVRLQKMIKKFNNLKKLAIWLLSKKKIPIN